MSWMGKKNTAKREARRVKDTADIVAEGWWPPVTEHDARMATGEDVCNSPGPELDREIDRLAELYPEPQPRADSDAVMRGREAAAELDRRIAAGEIQRGPYGPIVTDLDREMTEAWEAEDRQAAADLAAEEAAVDAMSPAEREQRDRELMREVYEDLWPEDREAG